MYISKRMHWSLVFGASMELIVVIALLALIAILSAEWDKKATSIQEGWGVRTTNLENRVSELETRLAKFERISKDPRVLNEVLDRYAHNDEVRKLLQLGGKYLVDGRLVDCMAIDFEGTLDGG